MAAPVASKFQVKLHDSLDETRMPSKPRIERIRPERGDGMDTQGFSSFGLSVLTRRTVLTGLGAAGIAAVLAARPLGGASAGQEATPGTLPAPLDAWLHAWGVDPTGADTLYAADAVLEDVAGGVSFLGPAEIRAHIEEEFVGFPDHAYAVSLAFVAGDMAAVELVYTGTYTGTYAGLPPGSGQAVSVRVAAILELAGGQIRREAHYYDAYGFLAQLGVLPAPGAETTPAA